MDERKRKLTLRHILTCVLAFMLLVAMLPGRPMQAEEGAVLKNPQILKEVSEDKTVSGKKTVWDCIYFGSYPQNEVTDEESVYGQLQGLADSDWDANGDVVIGGEKYRRLCSSDATYVDSRSASEYYPWTGERLWHYFRYEPIKWRVLKTDGKQAFLLADLVLDGQKFAVLNPLSQYNWEHSSLRSWLNGYDAQKNSGAVDYTQKNFLDSAFSEQQQQAILTTSVVNEMNSVYVTDGGKDTEDKLFLPSISEVHMVDYGFTRWNFEQDEARYAQCSTYAWAMGVYQVRQNKMNTGNCYWWLRSPGLSRLARANVAVDGMVMYAGKSLEELDYGVRPALNLNLEAADYQYAGTVCSDGTFTEKTEGKIGNPQNFPAEIAMKSGQIVTWDSVYFGTYPQSEVAEKDSVYSELQKADGWDVNEDLVVDGVKYRRIPSYYSSPERYFRYEPVKWRVLKVDDTKALLMSELILDYQKYHLARLDNEGYAVTWETCTLRSWFNGYGAQENAFGTDYQGQGFWDTAFSIEEQAAVISSSLESMGRNVEDKVFMLSEKELLSRSAEVYGFVSQHNIADEARQARGSAYADAVGNYRTTVDTISHPELGSRYGGNGCWWIRFMGSCVDETSYVDYDGYVYPSGRRIDQYYNGIRVALNLDISRTDLYQYAGTVSSEEHRKTISLDRGDVNGDWKVNLEDAQLALKIVLGIISPEEGQKEAANVDGKGDVTLSDVQMILKAALKITAL